MTRFALALSLTLLPFLPETAAACSLKLSEFQAQINAIEGQALEFEQQVLAENRKVRQQSADVRQISYGTECDRRMKSRITATQEDISGLLSRLHRFEQKDDGFFGCILSLRERGSAALQRAQSLGDTTRVLRVQQALKDLTDYDVRAVDLSIRISVTVSKATRLQRETEINMATCTPNEGGLDAIDF